MAKETRTFLVHIELHDITPDRLKSVAPRIIEALEDIAGKNHELVWRSLDRSVLAYVVQTQRNARQITTRFTLPSDTIQASISGVPRDKIKDWGQTLSNHDKVAVLELGDDTAEQGYGRLAGWLLSHHS